MKIDIVAGFLGTGKTTLINKLIPVFAKKEKVAVIENEFGEVGIDGDLILSDLPTREIYAGCICCSLSGSFISAIEELSQQYQVDRMVIEPSGVGQLSDVVKTCRSAKLSAEIKIDHLITIVDSTGFFDEIDAFGGFYLNQIINANIILLSRIELVEKREVEQIVDELQKVNPDAAIIKDDWRNLDNEDLMELLDAALKNTRFEIQNKESNANDNQYHAPASRIFTAWGQANPVVFTLEQLNKSVESLKEIDCGRIWRGKGVVKIAQDGWVYFDYTPGHCFYRQLNDAKTAKIAIIGCELNKRRLAEIFPAGEGSIEK